MKRLMRYKCVIENYFSAAKSSFEIKYAEIKKGLENKRFSVHPVNFCKTHDIV